MLLELASAWRPTLLHPSCKLLEEGVWANWYLLEWVMDGEREQRKGLDGARSSVDAQLKTRRAVWLVGEMSALRDQCSRSRLRPRASLRAAAGRAKGCQCDQAGGRHQGW